MSRPTFPMFELMGNPCSNPYCTGKMVQTLNMESNLAYYGCTVCGAREQEMTIQEKLGYSIRTIERAAKGEKQS